MQLGTYTLADGTTWLLPTWAVSGPESGPTITTPVTYSADVLAVSRSTSSCRRSRWSSERRTAGYDRHVDAHRTVIDEATATLDAVDQALVRLSEGTYRTCEPCGATIGDEQLAGAPTLRRCAEHAAEPS